jgi:hypothetical protein
MSRKHHDAKRDTPETIGPVDDPADRRRDDRTNAKAVPQLSASIVDGATVKLLNLSPRGVLLETSMALPPGRPVSLRFMALDADLVLTGCVVRSSVGTLSGSSITYQTAITFGQENTLYTRLLAEASAPVESFDVPGGGERDEELMVVVSVARNIEGVRTMIGAIA